MRERLPDECRDAADVLDVAEFRDEHGRLRVRLCQYFSADGSRWVCHGPFTMFHANGTIAVEGQYTDGVEEGYWREYHANGRPAAEGCIFRGERHAYWQFWTPDGAALPNIEYDKGVDVQSPEYEPDW